MRVSHRAESQARRDIEGSYRSPRNLGWALNSALRSAWHQAATGSQGRGSNLVPATCCPWRGAACCSYCSLLRNATVPVFLCENTMHGARSTPACLPVRLAGRGRGRSEDHCPALRWSAPIHEKVVRLPLQIEFVLVENKRVAAMGQQRIQLPCRTESSAAQRPSGPAAQRASQATCYGKLRVHDGTNVTELMWKTWMVDKSCHLGAGSAMNRRFGLARPCARVKSATGACPQALPARTYRRGHHGKRW